MSTQRLSAYAQLYNNYYNLARAYISYRVKNKSDGEIKTFRNGDILGMEKIKEAGRGVKRVKNGGKRR